MYIHGKCNIGERNYFVLHLHEGESRIPLTSVRFRIIHATQRILVLAHLPLHR